MKFTVGYRQLADGEFAAIIDEYQACVQEVFFAWPLEASGRNAAGVDDPWYLPQMLDDLALLRDMGIKLDLLYNATCYGAWAVSRKFELQIAKRLEFLAQNDLLPEVITTASPFVARTVKRFDPAIEIRASVNLRIDSAAALEYGSAYFDSFYIRRDRQRDLAFAAEMKQHADRLGKQMLMLVNSGCLGNCPSQQFHDNLIAHSSEASFIDNCRDWEYHLCREMYAKPEQRVEILRSSWIRPEDLAAYEPYIKLAKLATRQTSDIRRVLRAYSTGRYHGNLLDLLEPGFTAMFHPYYIDNGRFPALWQTTAKACSSFCSHCGKCDEVWRQVLRQD